MSRKIMDVKEKVKMELVGGWVISSNLGQTRVKTKDFKNGSYCCYVRCVTQIVGVQRMHLPKQAQLINMHS